jgi:hypothetical protein
VGHGEKEQAGAGRDLKRWEEAGWDTEVRRRRGQGGTWRDGRRRGGILR